MNILKNIGSILLTIIIFPIVIYAQQYAWGIMVICAIVWCIKDWFNKRGKQV